MAARKPRKTLQALATEVGTADSDLAFLRALLAKLSALIEDKETPASVVVQLDQEVVRVMTLVRAVTAGAAPVKGASLIDQLRVVK